MSQGHAGKIMTSCAPAAVPPLAPVETTAHHLPPREQFDFWRDRYLPVMEFRNHTLATDGFEASATAWQIGDCLLSRVARPAVEIVRSARSVRRVPVDHWVISVARHGVSMTEGRYGTRSIPSGAIWVHSLGAPFVSRDTATDRLVLYLSRDHFAVLAGALDALCGQVLDTPMARILADWMLSLERRLPQVGRDALPALRNATQAIVAACLAPTPDHAAAASDAIGAMRLERIRRNVRARLADPGLGPAVLAAQAGMSRSALYRLLEHEGGVAHFIQHQRLLAASVLLADPANTRTIQWIADSVGFSDAATFSRAFRTRFGCTPGEARAEAARGQPRTCPSALPTVAGGATFQTLLRPWNRAQI